MAKHLVIIGAQRSGTTYLYKILDAHPEIYMAKPMRPEPKYFMDNENTKAGYDAYFSQYFSESGRVTWLGEKSTSYIESKEAAIAINRILPGATILVMLRDPIERAISHYKFTRSHNLEPYDIKRAFLEEPLRKDSWQLSAKTSVSPYAYTERGKYAQYLECWERLFGKDKLLLLVAEQLIGSELEIKMLYQRLGIDSGIVPPNMAERVNAGSAERSEVGLPPELRGRLEEVYQPWNRELEVRYGLDLSCWGRKA